MLRSALVLTDGGTDYGGRESVPVLHSSVELYGAPVVDCVVSVRSSDAN